ncbi:Ankyrin repeat [Sparganum proliferum]
MIASSMKASHIIAVLNICKRGDVVFLKKLLATDCNFNEVVDRKGRNALHYCAETDSVLSGQAKPGGRLACAELLLESKFNLKDQADNDGFLPFHHAVIHGNIPLVQLLLTHGVDVNCAVRPSDVQNSPAVAGRTAFHLAVIYSNYEMLEFLLSGSFELNDVPHQFQVDVQELDAQCATALHYAIQLPEAVAASMIKCIIEKSSIRIDSPDAHRRTPLHWAATIGAAHAASILIELGADMTLVDESGLTAMHCAASRGHSGTVEAIIKHLPKEEEVEEEEGEDEEEEGEEEEEDTKLVEREEREDRETMEKQTPKVDSLRTRVLNAMDADGCTPIFYSVTMGHANVTRRLLLAGANACARDSRGRGLLHCVSRSMVPGSAVVVPLLVAHGVSPEWVNVVGESALHEACSNLNRECVAELLKLASVRQSSVLNAKNSSQHTPLQLATMAALRTNERPAACATAVEICRDLFSAGALAKSADGDGTEDISSPIVLVRSCLRSAPNYRPAFELEKLFSGEKDEGKDDEGEEEVGEEKIMEVTGTTVEKTEEHNTSEEKVGDDTDQDVDNTNFETEEEELMEAAQREKGSFQSSSSMTTVDSSESEKPNEDTSSQRTITPLDRSVPFCPSSEDSQGASPSKEEKEESERGEEEEDEKGEEKEAEREEEREREEDSQQPESSTVSMQQTTLPSSANGGVELFSKHDKVHEQEIIPSGCAKSSRRRSAPASKFDGRRRSSNRSRTSTKSVSRPPSQLRRISAPMGSATVERPPVFFRQTSCAEIGVFATPSRPSRTKMQGRRSKVSVPPNKTSTVSLSTITDPACALRRSLTDAALQTDSVAFKAAAGTQTSLNGDAHTFDGGSLLSSRSFISSTDTSTDLSQRRGLQPPYRKRPLSESRRGTAENTDAFRQNSRGIYESPITGRQRMPLPTITPYLTPVARWPRQMASMMLFGEVTPLYVTGRRQVRGPASPKQPARDAMTLGQSRFAERARSAIEARIQLTMAEKEFVNLAARVLQQYDTLSQEREALQIVGKQKVAPEFSRNSHGKRTSDVTRARNQSNYRRGV